MKNILLILLLGIPLCYAQPQENLAISQNYDSLKMVVDVLDKKQKETENSMDSLNSKFFSDKFVTVDVLEKSQNFYSTSFNNILWFVGIIISIACTVFGSFGAFNWWITKKAKKEVEKLKIQQKLLNEELVRQKKETGSVIEKLYKQLARSYFEGAVNTYDANDIDNIDMYHIKSHLIQLNSYFITNANLNLELNIDDFFFLGKIGPYIEGYKYIPESFVQFFSTGLKKFIDYCKTSGKLRFKNEDEQDFIEKAEKIWQVFFKKFDKGDIDDLIEKYKKMDINDRISMKHKAMRDSSDVNEKVRWANDHEE